MRRIVSRSTGSTSILRRAPGVLAISLGVTLSLVAPVVTPTRGAVASPSIEAYTARLGAGGANGAATLTVTAAGSGTVTLATQALKPSTSYVAAIRRGTCAAVGPALQRCPGWRPRRPAVPC
jgi:hypothetical protein